MALQRLTLETEYRSAQSELAAGFYRACLDNSIKYDRAAGYFSSTVYLVVGSKIIDFARKGGRMRLVCSPQLTSSDVEAITNGQAKLQDAAAARLIEELDSLLASGAGEFPARALATLVAVGSLDIRIAVRVAGYGIFHEKLGVFEDSDGNAVSFIGSSNETWQGWHPEGNYEAIEVFCSWTGDAIRVAKHRLHFSRIWERHDPSLLVLEVPDALRRRLCTVAASSLDALSAPRLTGPPERPIPREHQTLALNAWGNNGFRGILKHATGSGKTLTALFAMEPHLADAGVVLVLVPSRLLLEQWRTETLEYFPKANLLLAGAGHDDWKLPGTLRSFSGYDPLLGGRVIIATMQTARTGEFLSRLKQGAHLLLIADEVHQLGSTENSRCLQINAGKRLGLSATPERHNDLEGTARIFDYFGGLVPPEYSLADAIADQHLVPYEYHPLVVHLTSDESDDWKRISRDIFALRSGDSKEGSRAGSQGQIERLQIRRARIAKKAFGKLQAAQKTLTERYHRGERWLVYCEDAEQLRAVVSQTRTWCSDVLEYHTAMEGDAKATLQWFQDSGGILVAIACLDEGVNIPSVSHALILASSKNPRQFVQRRGRILRKFPGKRIAVIFDVLVSPANVDDEPLQRSLLKSELARALQFAASAVNGSAVVALRLIAIDAGIDPNSMDDSGEEESDDSEGG